MSKRHVTPADRIRYVTAFISNPDAPEMTYKETLILVKDALMAEYYGYKEEKNAIRRRRMAKRVRTHLSTFEFRKDLEHL